VTEYEKFVTYWLAQTGRRPTRRQVLEEAARLEEAAERRRTKARHATSRRKEEAALDFADDLEDTAMRLRSTVPSATNPCRCGCGCDFAVLEAYEERCAECKDGRHIPPPLRIQQPFIGSTRGS
jgi:hypothetical protein